MTWLFKIEKKVEDYLTVCFICPWMSFLCQIPRAVTSTMIKTAVSVSGAGTALAVIQHYIH
jgi:hypothetical protein